jgi:transcriptional regulator with AAA-type ATPase domain
VEHPALEASEGVALAEARLGDRERLAVLLQGAALLAHLRHARSHLHQGWGAGRVADEGLLGNLAAQTGAGAVSDGALLRGLLSQLFGGQARVAGRGEARRAARALGLRWGGALMPVDPDLAVAQVLDEAPFLWNQRFASARRALVGVHRGPDDSVIWVCGPGGSRRRLLAAPPEIETLRDLLGSSRARRLWQGELPSSRPAAELAAAGRWREAVALWRRQGPASGAERLLYARSLFNLGHFEQARAEAQEAGGHEGRLLAAHALYYLGRLGAAVAALPRPGGELCPEEVVAVAELAVRWLHNAGDGETARRWVERALVVGAERSKGGERTLEWRSRLVAAEACWDRGESEAMASHLEAARELLENPELAWRWHQVRALAAMAAGDGPGVVEAARNALAVARRRLPVCEAAGLWNEVAVGRVLAGDLAGAEKACAHAVRLLARSDGPRQRTLALRNLAEVRLRRGRLHGVREILEDVLVQNRLDGNLRSATQDAGLWARWELVQGRPHAALATCRAAFTRLEAAGSAWHRGELSVIAARALGWLGRSDEAREMLAETTIESQGLLEGEELPGLFAHAGEREAALAARCPTPWKEVWTAALTGGATAPGAWRALDDLEPYRAARLVWDWELVSPGFVPAEHVRQAAVTLRSVGASPFADRLEGRLGGPWVALARWLEEPTGDREVLPSLVATVAGDDACLEWEHQGVRQTLVGGAGGAEELAAPLGSGLLVLRSPRVDPRARALFALLCRLLPAPDKVGGEPAANPGFVGESAALRDSLAGLPRLARGTMPVLVLGESGTGKELVAQEAHRLSPRREGPFVAINCAALSESLILSDLFGHVRGAFTGADRDRAGVFETARGGTVFLDEIGDLPASAQGMLLRLLQEKEVRRVGESLSRKVDVRVVAATHRDLPAMVTEGGFRQDLYFRLRVAVVELPPLRQRGTDVLLLARHFLRRARPEAPPELSPAARERILAHSWPGNVRELENVLEVAAALADGGVIETAHLALPDSGASSAVDYHGQVEAFRRRLVEEALRAAGGRQAEAARRLGLTRQALSYLVRQLRIT